MEVLDHGQFTALDYCFFVIVFCISAAIGLYYAFKARNTVVTVDDYLLGGRNMAIFPVVCSLIATTISGSSIVGLAAEAYAYGTHIWMFAVTMLTMPIVVSWIFLPIFSQLKLSSCFKYFELRFNRRVRLLASGIFLLTSLIFLPVTVYVPALSFQKVTGLDTYVTVVILSLLCTTYTAIGGFKAVIWTDVLQLAMIFLSSVIVAVVGINSANGLSNVLSAANRGGRIIFIE